MQNKFADNLSLKIISFVVAVVIWASIANVVRPIVSDFINIPISVVNEDSILKLNKAYVIKNPLICKVNYKIEQDKSSIVRQSDFRAYIDLNDLLTTNDIPVHYEALNEVDKYISNIRIEPSTIHVVMDDAIRAELPIQYNITGKIDEGHSIGEVVLSPTIVYVSGSDEAIKNVSHVAINIPVSDQAENFSDKAKVHVIGKNGKEMPTSGLELSAQEINYSVSVFTRANVSLNAIVDGDVRSGYFVNGVTVSPNAIMLEGPRSVIENIYTIDLPIIDVNDATESIEKEILLFDILPAGTRCTSIDSVKVNVDISKTGVINAPTASTREGPSKETDVESAEE